MNFRSCGEVRRGSLQPVSAQPSVIGVDGAAPKSLRRRIYAVLRMAFKVLGLKRDRLGVGALGRVGTVSVAASAAGMVGLGRLTGYVRNVAGH